MSEKSEVNGFILKVGLTIGIAFCATIFIAHLRGLSHTPGDSVSWLNIIVMMVVVMVSGRQYREAVDGDNFTYGKAYGYITKLNLISSIVLTIFGYYYYSSIAPGDIEVIKDMANEYFAQLGTMTAEQSDAMLQLFNQTLSAGSMAFVMFFYQFIGTSFFGLVLANIIRAKRHFTIE